MNCTENCRAAWPVHLLARLPSEYVDGVASFAFDSTTFCLPLDTHSRDTLQDHLSDGSVRVTSCSSDAEAFRRAAASAKVAARPDREHVHVRITFATTTCTSAAHVFSGQRLHDSRGSDGDSASSSGSADGRPGLNATQRLLRRLREVIWPL